MKVTFQIPKGTSKVSFEELVSLGLSNSYKGAYLHFKAWLKTNKKALSANSIREYLISELNENKKPSTLQYKKSFLKQWLVKSFESHGKSSNDVKALDRFFKTIKLPLPDKKLYDYDTFTDAETKWLLGHCSKNVQLIIETLQQSGARISEILDIRLKNCINRGKSISITITGKRNKTRDIFITTQLFEQIKDVFNSKKFLFETRSGKKIDRKNTYNQFRRFCHKAIKNCNDDYLISKIQKCNLHTFRHSWATNRLSDGFNIYTVKEGLGHEKIQTTVKYLHIVPQPQVLLQSFLESATTNLEGEAA